MTSRDPVIAKAGDEIAEAARREYAERIGYRGDLDELLKGDTIPRVVAAKPEKPNEAGNWICITCGYIAAHNMDRDSHVSTRKNRRHAIAWRDSITGQIEAP